MKYIESIIRNTESQPGVMVSYYYRPATNYPARIYVFIEHDLWRSVGHKPMGLVDAIPFAKREMTQEESKSMAGRKYLVYHSFQSYEKLYEYSVKMGVDDVFLAEFTRYEQNFPLLNKNQNGREQLKQRITEVNDKRKNLPVSAPKGRNCRRSHRGYRVRGSKRR